MSKLLLPTLSLILAIWLLGGSWWYASKFGNKVIANSPYVPTLSAEEHSPTHPDKTHFLFKQSSDRLIVPKEALHELKLIAFQLNNEPSKSLELTGLYHSREMNNTQQTDLGLARAVAVKQQLIHLGAPSKSIIVNSLEEDNITLVDGHLKESVLFNFSKNNTLSTSYTENDGIKVWKVPSINLQFDNRKKALKLTTVLNDGFDKLKHVLAQEPDVMIIITGHTDNVGSRSKNLKLSKRRAVNVRDFMIENGFDKDRLQIQYKGPDDPIASNDNKEGRKKNRRVEIRIR